MASLWALVGPVLATAGAVALPLGVNALLRQLRLQRVLPLLRRAYVVLDPLFNAHLPHYRGSDVQFAARLVTTVLADGRLSPDELDFAAAELLRRWSPALAAGQQPDGLLSDSQERKLYTAVEGLIAKGGYSFNSLGEAALSIKHALS